MRERVGSGSGRGGGKPSGRADRPLILYKVGTWRRSYDTPPRRPYLLYIPPISRLYLAYIYQVGKWRRSYDTPPPEIELSSPYWPGNDNRYAHIPEEEIPLT